MTDNWVLDLNAPKSPLAEIHVEEWLPIVGEPDRWEQFSDPVVYELDRLMREWLEKMSENKKWVRSRKLRMYTFAMIFEQIFGRKYDSVNGDAIYVSKLSKIIAWYSTKIQKSGYINGRTVSKTFYTVSPNRLKTKPPYSLKLRLKWFGEQGIVPTYSNMRLPKDDLRPGHARNPRSEANMQKRREQGRKRYNERYKDRDR